jgi:CelD/BcsL family acetyltransferase involved in cellulose biosynthesis
VDLHDPGEQARLLRSAQTKALAHASIASSEARIGEVTFSFQPTFDFMSPEYRHLFERADATAFQDPIWLDEVFARLARNGKHETIVLTGRETASTQLVFVLPLILRKFGPVHLFDAADSDVGDYNAMVVDRRYLSACSLERLCDVLPLLGFVRIRRARDDADHLTPGSQKSRRTFMDYRAHEVELRGASPDWRAGVLEDGFARYLAKKRKRLAAKGSIRLEEMRDPQQIRSAFVSMRQFRESRWSRDLLANPAYFEFYVAVACRGCESGLTRTYVLSVNGQAVSVMFGLAHRGRFSFVLLAFSAELFRNLSTGLLMIESAIQDCFDRNDHTFDMTIGDEDYKKNFATRSVAMQTVWIGKTPWPWIGHAALSSILQMRRLRGKFKSRKAKAA